jgi:hypothetical protein
MFTRRSTESPRQQSNTRIETSKKDNTELGEKELERAAGGVNWGDNSTAKGHFTL